MKKVLLFLAEGFEEIEALTVVDVLRRASITCDTCSIKDTEVTGAHGITVKADKLIEDINKADYDVVVLPGGMPGSTNLRDNEKVINIVKEFYSSGKLVSAICAAPIVLAKAGILEDKKVTSYPGFQPELGACSYSEELVVQDGNLLTSRGPATALYFAYKLVENIKGQEEAANLREGMLVNLLENNIKSM
ncbi:MAG: DJ-1/PfpI family protein [Bacillota bacterium]|nr:DJ-1/PfpI family protein [Bacillota bacterium]